MRHYRFLAGAAVLAALAFPAAGCRVAPRLDAGIGWSSTDSMTGPHLDIGLGEYQAADPINGGSPCPGGVCAPAAPDPALVQGMAALEAKAAEAKAQVAALDAKVAAGALTPEQAATIREATAKADTAAQVAREATARAETAQAKAAEAEGKAGKMPPIPTDWSPTGILAAAVAFGLWYIRRKAATLARAAADAAKAEALEAQAAAIKEYDAAPYTVADANSLAAASAGRPQAVAGP